MAHRKLPDERPFLRTGISMARVRQLEAELRGGLAARAEKAPVAAEPR